MLPKNRYLKTISCQSYSGDIFFGIRKRLLLVFYGISCLAIATVILIVVNEISSTKPAFQILISMFLMIVGTIGGAFLSSILDLPMIGPHFDKIKNDVASRKIKGPEDFAYRVSILICEYFNFTFLNIEYALFKVSGTAYSFSNNILASSISPEEYESMLQTSKITKEVTFDGSCNVGGKKYFKYIIPVWFGDDEWLGYITVFTQRKLGKLFIQFLSSFEDDYVDDQLVHAMYIKKIEPASAES